MKKTQTQDILDTIQIIKTSKCCLKPEDSQELELPQKLAGGLILLPQCCTLLSREQQQEQAFKLLLIKREHIIIRRPHWTRKRMAVLAMIFD